MSNRGMPHPALRLRGAAVARAAGRDASCLPGVRIPLREGEP